MNSWTRPKKGFCDSESKWTFVPNIIKFPFLISCVHKNGTDVRSHWPLAFDCQTIISSSSSSSERVRKFEDNPSRRSRDTMFKRMGRTGGPKRIMPPRRRQLWKMKQNRENENTNQVLVYVFFTSWGLKERKFLTRDIWTDSVLAPWKLVASS